MLNFYEPCLLFRTLEYYRYWKFQFEVRFLQEVDEDGDGFISFREFLLIFRKAAAGELKEDSGLSVLAKQCEVDVHSVGVGGAKNFFEAKVKSFFLASGSLIRIEVFMFFHNQNLVGFLL